MKQVLLLVTMALNPVYAESHKLKVYNEIVRNSLLKDIYGEDKKVAENAFDLLVGNETDKELLAQRLIAIITDKNKVYKTEDIKKYAIYQLGEVGIYNNDVKGVLVSNLISQEHSIIGTAIVALVKLEPDDTLLEQLYETAPSVRYNEDLARTVLGSFVNDKIYNSRVKNIILNALASKQYKIVDEAVDALVELEPDKSITIKVLQEKLKHMSMTSGTAYYIKKVIDNGGHKAEKLGELIFH